MIPNNVHKLEDKYTRPHSHNFKRSKTLENKAARPLFTMYHMPMVFQTSNLTYDERFSVYCNKILKDCKASEVKSKIAEYVKTNVKKCAWKAIWSTVMPHTNEALDILVQVRW